MRAAVAGHPFVIAKAGKPLVQVTAIPAGCHPEGFIVMTRDPWGREHNEQQGDSLRTHIILMA